MSSSSSPPLSQPTPHPRRAPHFRDDTDAVLVLNNDGTIDHVSETARRLLNLGARPVAGHSFFRQIPLDDVGRAARTIRTLSPRESGHATGLLQLKTGLGPWQWFKVEMTPRRQYEDEAGVVLRLYERGGRSSALRPPSSGRAGGTPQR